MPINIEVRKNNRIVTLNIPGKMPILSRNGSFNFHNPMELLCVAYGSCFGREFWDYCRFNNINVDEFESFVITMEDNIIVLTVQHPKDITDELKKDIKRLSHTCPISKMLSHIPKINFIENETAKSILIDETRRSNCCGNNKNI